ncbi:AbrB/MazE/SpoVT family DNA-binding domain-containing protein [Halobaculum rarum]|uniref:AbrB/MazE/SpoVT family DNA-binding domain-containing protein n=1 Tax=Halobaculum rarum TaxID=3075122 RepID=UPI003D68AA7E
MRTTARVVDSGKITIPVEIRDGLGIEEGSLVELDVRPIQSADSRTHPADDTGDQR